MVKVGDRVRLTYGDTMYGLKAGEIWPVCAVSEFNGSVEIDCEVPVGPLGMRTPWKAWIYADRFEVVVDLPPIESVRPRVLTPEQAEAEGFGTLSPKIVP